MFRTSQSVSQTISLDIRQACILNTYLYLILTYNMFQTFFSVPIIILTCRQQNRYPASRFERKPDQLVCIISRTLAH